MHGFQWVAGNKGQSVQCTTAIPVPRGDAGSVGCRDYRTVCTVYNQYRSRVEMLGQWVAGTTGQSVQCTTNTGPAWRCWVSGLQEIQGSLYSVQPIPVPRGDAWRVSKVNSAATYVINPNPFLRTIEMMIVVTPPNAVYRHFYSHYLTRPLVCCTNVI